MRKLSKKLAKLADSHNSKNAKSKISLEKLKIWQLKKSYLSSGKFEALPEIRGTIINVEDGRLVFTDNTVIVYTQREDEWGPLTPLVNYMKTQEIFIRGESVAATIGDVRYKVVLPEGINTELLIQRLAILSGARLSESNPSVGAEYKGWRLYFKMPLISGEWELTATKIMYVPRLTSIVHPLLAARLMLLTVRPSVVAIIGPAGSGKTTLLNSIVAFAHILWPHLRISVVEQVRELILPEEANIARSVAGPNTSVTTLIRRSMRYERPELFILGELRGEEIFSWIEAGRLGIGTLTTIHAPSLEKAVESMKGLMRQHMEATTKDVLRLIDVFVITRKFITFRGVRRGVSEVYVTTSSASLQPIFIDSKGHIPDEDFLELIPSKIMVGNSDSIYEMLKERLGYKEAVFCTLEEVEI